MNIRRVFTMLMALGLFMSPAACTIKPGLKKDSVALEGPATQPERTPIYRLGEWIVARASLHNHTTYSDGCRTPEDLLEMARRQGMAILAITDHREGKFCVGKSGICVESGGIEVVGYDTYFDHLRRLDATAADAGMLLIKGVEVIPFIYNYGKAPALVVDGPQHHFVVYGVEDPAVFDNMPTTDSVTIKPVSDPGFKPWQTWVDYMIEHGAIVTAAHVEEGADMWVGPIHGAAPPPIENAHRLEGLDGFAAFNLAWRIVPAPGGLWDTALIEYLYGMREKPLWTLADADYHGPHGSLALATTLFYMREFTEQEVLACLRDGRMVALQGEAFQDSYVAEWWVAGKSDPRDPVMLGQWVTLDGPPRVRFALDHEVPGCKTRLIRNGKVVMEVAGTELDFIDQEQGKAGEPAYYRVEIVGPVKGTSEHDPVRTTVVSPEKSADQDFYTTPESVLLVNPIFINFK